MQLDGWHEASHPSHWKTDFMLEAELHDHALFGQDNQPIHSEMIRVPCSPPPPPLQFFPISQYLLGPASCVWALQVGC